MTAQAASLNHFDPLMPPSREASSEATDYPEINSLIRFLS
jgi:hypothetical protein